MSLSRTGTVTTSPTRTTAVSGPATGTCTCPAETGTTATRDHITTFERLFIEDKAAWKEDDNPYYAMINDPGFADVLLREFDLDPTVGHIINGHVPVAAQKGESPIKGGGKVIVIDGGFCKAYQPKTGIAGYTLIFDSYGMRIAAHEPFPGLEAAISNNSDILSQEEVFEQRDRKSVV